MVKKDYSLDDYPLLTIEKLRYRDADSQGHVNNAVYVTLLEVGRTEVLFDPDYDLRDEDTAFMVAHIAIDYLAEVTWPGTVVIGNRISHIGRSSLTLEQVIFSDNVCAAVGKTVMVKVNKSTRKSEAISDQAKLALAKLQ